MKTKYIKRKYPKFYILAAFTLLCFLAVGYSYINSDLGIEAAALAASNRWNIVISNMQVNPSSTYGSQTNNSNGSQMTFDLSLTNATQSYIIDFDVTNNGSLKAYLNEISYEMTGYSNLDNYLEYKYTYSDGTEVKLGDVLNPNVTVHMKLFINYLNKLPYEYNDNINSKTISYGINIKYEFKSNEKEKITIYDNQNQVIETRYLSKSGDYIEIDSDSSYNFMWCEGASAYEENGKIRIRYEQNDLFNESFCKAKKDIDFINNIEETDKNTIFIYQLKDYEFDGTNIIVYPHSESGFSLFIFLNGKNFTYYGSSNSYSIQIDNMEFINNKGNSIINLYNKAIDSHALVLNGGTYNLLTSNPCKVIVSRIMSINNATININNTDNTSAIETSTGVSLNNSTINSNYVGVSIEPFAYGAPFDPAINMNNSTINSTYSNSISAKMSINNLDNTEINICNSTLNSNTYDIDELYGELVYSSNSHFNSSSPTINNMNSASYILKNDAACEIVKQRINSVNKYIEKTVKSNFGS